MSTRGRQQGSDTFPPSPTSALTTPLSESDGALTTLLSESDGAQQDECLWKICMSGKLVQWFRQRNYDDTRDCSTIDGSTTRSNNPIQIELHERSPVQDEEHYDSYDDISEGKKGSKPSDALFFYLRTWDQSFVFNYPSAFTKMVFPSYFM